jgi:hypothetical protein
MFRCDRCNKVSNPHETQNKVVVERRVKTYPSGNTGWEIVKEDVLCGDCKKEAA